VLEELVEARVVCTTALLVVTNVDDPEVTVETIPVVTEVGVPKMVEAPVDVTVEPLSVTTVVKLEVETGTEPPAPPLPPAPPPTTLKMVVEPTVETTCDPPLAIVVTIGAVVIAEELCTTR
jgi:hypothetical protein